MKALLTNDDGIDAEGLDALRRAAEGYFEEIWVVAPSQQASEIGHRVTTRGPIRYRRVDERVFAVDGTPADCVRVALSHLLPEPPGWVLSGINHGGNLGRHDFAISGTVAAVREAAFAGLRGAAVSQFLRRELEVDWGLARARTSRALERLFTEPAGAGEFWTVNLPHTAAGPDAAKIVFCEQERHSLLVRYIEKAPGELHYAGDYHERPRRPGSDVDVCFGGDIAVSRASV